MMSVLLVSGFNSIKVRLEHDDLLQFLYFKLCFNSIKVRLELIIILRLETSESMSNEMQSYEKCLGKMSMPNGVFSVLLRQREFLWRFQ